MAVDGAQCRCEGKLLKMWRLAGVGKKEAGRGLLVGGWVLGRCGVLAVGTQAWPPLGAEPALRASGPLPPPTCPACPLPCPAPGKPHSCSPGPGPALPV